MGMTARKQEELRDNERLSLMVESARLGTWDWNIQTGEFIWSRECLEMFGLPHDAAMSYELFLQAVHPEDREPIDRAVKLALQTGDEYATEMRAIWPDGSVHWIASRGRAYFNKTGDPIRMSGAAMDITQFKETEEKLQRAQADATAQADNFAAILDVMPAAAFYSNDRECKLMVASRAAYELLRLPYGTNVSKTAERERPTYRMFENGRELSSTELPMQRAAATGLPVNGKELEIRFEDGSSVFIFGHAVPLFDEAHQVRGAVGTFLDITDRKVIEERLRAATERFQVALRGTPITVFSQDTDLRYKWIHNPVGGHVASQIIGKTDRELLEDPKDAALFESIKGEVLRTGKSYQGEVSASILGVRHYYHVNIDPQRDAAGRVNGLTCATFELTDRRRMEADREKLARQRQLALDAVKLGWWHYDVATATTTWDETFRGIFGFQGNSGSAEDFFRVIHPDDLAMVLGRFESVLKATDSKPYSGEHRIIRPDGSIRWLEGHATAEFEGTGVTRKVVGCAGVVRDITDSKGITDALRASETRYRELAENLEREVQARTRELQERNADVMRTSEGLRELSARLLQIQDEERRSIARELHDSAGQLVTALDLELQSLSDEIKQAAPTLTKNARSAVELVRHLHEEIRTTSYLLHPPLLDEAGLYSAISWYVHGLNERSGIEIELDMAQSFGRLPREIELVVFRLVQEALTNIHRHSGSGTASIRIARENGMVSVDVRDRGKGMSAERLAMVQSGGSGVGIRGMRERVRQIHGELQISSTQSGTRLWATIPIKQRKDAGAEEGVRTAI
jgi:PAS domain S-box-containing protein